MSLSIQLENLPSPQSERLKKWLIQPERFEVEKSVRAELAELEVKISSEALDNYFTVLQSREVPKEAGDAILAASILRNFLEILERMSAEDYSFRQAKVAIE